MANPFNLPEVTLAQLGDSTHTINVIDPTGSTAASPRKSVYQPIVALVTDHDDNSASANLSDWPSGADTNLTVGGAEDVAYLEKNGAIFLSRRHGEQWEKQYGYKQHIIAKATRGTGATVNTTTINGVIIDATIAAGGTNYAKGDTLTVGAGGTVLLVTSVNDGVITGITPTVGGTGYTNGTGVATAGIVPTNVTNLYVDFDYSTFE